jgi:hypothetical protein
MPPALLSNVTNMPNARFHYYVIGRHFSFNSRKGPNIAQLPTIPNSKPLSKSQPPPHPCPMQPAASSATSLSSTERLRCRYPHGSQPPLFTAPQRHA